MRRRCDRQCDRQAEDLGRLWLFAGCPTRELRKLSKLGTRTKVGAGTRLVSEGAYDHDVMVVLSGTATCVVGTRLVASFGAGDLFGEIAALDDSPRTATVEAATDMELIVLDRRHFERSLDLSPPLAMRVLQVAARRLRSANDLVAV